MGEQAARPGNERIWFWGLLALAVALRAVAFDPFAMHHPDEVLQYIEPAYRLVTGQGTVTWEYRYGMRSGLVPLLLAAPMELVKAFGGSAFAAIVATRIMTSMVGLIPVVAAWRIGRRTSPTHGIVAMAVMALWFEQVVYSTHVLTESLATAMILGAAALIDRKAIQNQLLVGGALLALAVIFRFQYALAIGVFLMIALQRDWQRWGWLIAGAVPIVLLSSAVDLSKGQWPFQWVFINFQLNVVEGRASLFGIEAPDYFLRTIWDLWGLWALPLAILAVESGKQYRPILYAAMVNLAAHSLIPHKEYRFIELTIAAIILLAAIGSVNAWQWIERRRGKPLPVLPTLAALLLGWAGLSAWLGRGNPLDQWHGERSTGQELAYRAGQDPRVCGIGTITNEFWQLSRAYIGRPMTVILLERSPTPYADLMPPGPELASVNAVIAPARSKPLLPGYAVVQCKGPQPFTRCLYVRPGGCTPTPEAAEREIDKFMLRNGM